MVVVLVSAKRLPSFYEISMGIFWGIIEDPHFSLHSFFSFFSCSRVSGEGVSLYERALALFSKTRSNVPQLQAALVMGVRSFLSLISSKPYTALSQSDPGVRGNALAISATSESRELRFHEARLGVHLFAETSTTNYFDETKADGTTTGFSLAFHGKRNVFFTGRIENHVSENDFESQFYAMNFSVLYSVKAYQVSC